MQEYQQKVIEEKEELDNKIKLLQNFIETNKLYIDLPDYEKKDMTNQLDAMRFYSSCLKNRINRF